MLPIIKSCFGPDDDDSEKYEIKNKRERKVQYNPNQAKAKHKIKLQKNMNINANTGYNSESLLQSNAKTGTDSEQFNSEELPRKSSAGLDLSKFEICEKAQFDMEYDFGNVEYKLMLCDLNIERIQALTSQMKFRLEEGNGECFYEIGVEDNGNQLGISVEQLENSVDSLQKIAQTIDSTATITKLYKGKLGLIAEISVKKKEEVFQDKLEIKIGLLGEGSSGKSTLIGVLVSNKLDNGKGLARTNVFRHKHEILCGKTSSISHQILGFDENGDLTNYGSIEKPSWAQIVHKSAKIVNFYDMGGSKKIFKKTMTTFSPNYLDYLLLVISSQDGITQTTEDLLNFSSNMNLPIITIFTKIDLIDEQSRQSMVQNFKSLVSKLKIQRVPLIMKSTDDIVLFARNIEEKHLMPTFLVSNIQWEGLNLFKSFLSMLPINISLEKELKSIEKEKMEFDIHETIAIDHKLIVVGIVNKGKAVSGSKCYLGPDPEGKFKIVEIVNIHCKKVPVKYSYKGQYCSIFIKYENNLTKDDVRKGMVLLDINSRPASAKMFEVELWTIDGSRKVIKNKYQPILNIRHIRQGAKIKNCNELFCLNHFENSNEKKEDITTSLERLILDQSLNLDNVKSVVEKIKLQMSELTSMKKLNSSNSRKKVFVHAQDISTTQDEVVISSTKKSKVIFEFMFTPEYLTVGSHVIIIDNFIKAYGIITKVFK